MAKMKFINKKSSVGLLMLPTFGFALGVILFFMFAAPKIDDYIGGKQAAVMKVVGQGEQVLSGVDVAAKLAAWQSIFDLGRKGGFYSEQLGDTVPDPDNYPCDKYVYNLWNDNLEKCWPDPFKGYEKNFDYNFKYKYLIQVNDAFQSINYNYTVGSAPDASTVIAGVADKTLPVEISYTYVKEKETPVVKEAASEKDKAFISSDYGFFSWPVDVKSHIVTSGFGARLCTDCSPNHAAVDISAPFGAPVLAAADGKVRFLPSGMTSCWGAIIIDHGNDLSSFYLHLDSYQVTDGQEVKRGDKIGVVGHRGKAKGTDACVANAYPDSHLHFGVLYDKVQQGLTYKNQLAFMHDFEMNIFVQPLCFFDKNGGFMIDKSASNKNTPINAELDQVCKLYNFPEQFLKPREEAGATTTTPSTTGTSSTSEAQNTGSQPANAIEIATAKSSAGNGTLTLNYVSRSDYDRVMQYGALIKKAAEEFKIPEAKIAATIYYESKGYADAVSGKEESCLSGVGLGQFRYDTAAGGVFRDIFGSGLTKCGCCGGSYTSQASIGCRLDQHNCPPTDPRLDAEKSIRAIAAYHKQLSAKFSKYKDKDAFDFMSYFQGPGAVDSSIANAYKATGNSNPAWTDVVNYLLKDGKPASQKAKEGVHKYVDEILKAMADFGGGSYSSFPVYTNVISPEIATQVTRFEELRQIGYYHINPSFTTKINYDMEVYESIRKWADYTYEKCHTQTIMRDCVEEQVNVMKKLYAKSTEPAITSSELAKIQPLFNFVDFGECDGQGLEGFYDFTEFLESCSEFGTDKCYCQAPLATASTFGSNHLKISSSGLTFYNGEGTELDHYDFSAAKKAVLKDKGAEVDSFTIKTSDSGYVINYLKDNKPSLEGSSKKLYFVKKGNVLERVDDVTGMNQCNFKGQHKFRFCAVSEQKIPYYYEADNILIPEQVPIRFALDFKKIVPPAITAQGAEQVADVQGQNEEATLPEDKKCKDFGKAEFTLKVTTPELQSAYEKFISSFVTKLVPQLTVLLFVKNALVAMDSMPALVNVQLDLKGADKNCDITGLVYKCGVGIIPSKDGKFDFSSPTGYVDISPRFNSGGGISVQSPDACMILKNPDGAYTPARYISPQISGDIVSFSLDKCADPILQFKKMEGVDIITSALNGFGYYFAFAYVDSAGNYGKATIKSIQIPSILQKLEEELGISNWFALINIVRGDYEGIFNLLGLSDEFTFIRRAIASASLDRFLRNIKGEVFNAALTEVEKNIRDEDAMKIFDDFARDGRLDDDYAAKLLENAKAELKIDEAEKFIDQLQSTDLNKAYDYYIKQLPLEKKRQLLSRVYERKDEIQRMGEAEVNARLSRAMRAKDQALRVVKALDPQDKIDLVKDFITQQPSRFLSMAGNALSNDEKVATVRNALKTVSDAQSGLARLITQASPDYAKKAAFDYITNQPGFKEYKDSITQIFSDYPSSSCS
jgi:murein DD-endopeptidase MepM/ murein hydrolase activator NlpD